ncbi:hypothetical protein [Halobacteriovorax sp. DPLXC-1]|uniref:hypothetical protein n=1 Tax=Halobacteriovorax sp. DPLXC-1 TaxID=3110771 RepID=UPI002FEE8298
MKKLLVLATVLFVSCNSSDKEKINKSVKLASNEMRPTFSIECESFRTNLVSSENKVTCEESGSTNRPMYLRNINSQKSLSLYDLTNENEIELEVSLDEKVVEATFILVSKNGKELSNQAYYHQNDRKIFFYEVEEDAFINHKVHLKTLRLRLKNDEIVTYNNEVDNGCVTGKISLDEFKSLVQPEQCKGLKSQTIYTGAVVKRPIFHDIKVSDVGYRKVPQIIISKPVPRNWKPYRVIEVQHQYTVRYFDYFEESVEKFNDFFRRDDFGNLEITKSKECLVRGVVEYRDWNLRTRRWDVLNDETVYKHVYGEIEIQGEVLDAVEDYKRQECFDLKPKPVGYVLIQE